MKFRYPPRHGVLRAAAITSACMLAVTTATRAANQTATLSPVIVGAPMSFATTIGSPASFSGTLPTLHSFSKATFTPAGGDHSQWLVLGGMTNGLHDLTGAGSDPASHNRSVYVIDPVTKQVWSRSLLDGSSGLSSSAVETIATTNAQHTQIGNNLYLTGGYGFAAATQDYQTFDALTSVDVDQLAIWVKGGGTSAALSIRQIHDPLFRVTGGEMATTANGRTHLMFGQDYPSSYEPRQNGIYTYQVRSFRVVDDAGGLSVTDVVAHPQAADYRRRDLNVVPVVHKNGGAITESLQALAGRLHAYVSARGRRP